jgi:hypothetical protein
MQHLQCEFPTKEWPKWQRKGSRGIAAWHHTSRGHLPDTLAWATDTLEHGTAAQITGCLIAGHARHQQSCVLQCAPPAVHPEATAVGMHCTITALLTSSGFHQVDLMRAPLANASTNPTNPPKMCPRHWKRQWCAPLEASSAHLCCSYSTQTSQAAHSTTPQSRHCKTLLQPRSSQPVAIRIQKPRTHNRDQHKRSAHRGNNAAITTMLTGRETRPLSDTLKFPTPVDKTGVT